MLTAKPRLPGETGGKAGEGRNKPLGLYLTTSTVRSDLGLMLDVSKFCDTQSSTFINSLKYIRQN